MLSIKEIQGIERYVDGRITHSVGTESDAHFLGIAVSTNAYRRILFNIALSP